MKILFFINGLAAGGKERRLVELMKGLKKDSAIEFELAVMDQDIHYKEVYDLGIKIHFLIRKTKKDLSVFFKLYSLSKKIRPDILHCWDSMTAVYSVPVCRLLNIKLINGMVVGAPEKKTFFDPAYRRAKLTFLFSDCIIGNSQAGLAAYRAPERKSICIHNGFNFERLNRFRSVEKTKEELGIKTDYVIGMVASFSPFKDYKTFFEAVQLLLKERNDTTFLVIGSNTDSEEARKMIQDNYIEHFRLLGKRSDIEILINIMDIAVLSTFTEGISNSILEYMALGKPVVATEGGGTSEIVADGITGFLVKRSSPQEFSNRMIMLLNDDSLRLAMGSAGKERIQQYFTIEKMISSYIIVYQNLCGI